MKLLLLSVLLSVKFQTFDTIKHANSTQSKSLKDSLKDSITLYIELGGSCFGNKKYKEAIKYYEVALVLAQKNKDISLQADINVKIGDVYSKKGVKYESVSYFKKAQSLYGITKNTKKKLGLNIKIGDIYCKMEDSYEAIASYSTSLQEYKKMASYKDIAATLCRIAKVYEIQGQYDQGLDFLAQSSENIKKLHDSSDKLMVISDIYETTGLIYYRKKEYTKALDYQLKCYSLRKKLPVDDYFDDLNNIGKIHTRLNQYDSAFYYYNKAELIAELSGYKVNIAHININIGHAYLDQNQYKKAIERLKKGLSIAEKIKRKTMARHSSMLLCLTYESMHDNKNALKYLRNYISWKDSLFNKLSKREMANFDAKYRAKEKEQKILLLNKDKKLSLALLIQERLKQQRLWTIFGVVIPLIVIGMYLWHKYRGKIMIAHQDNIRLKAVIEAEQKERKRISQDLHDSLGQLISIAKFKASDIDPKESSIEDHQNLMNIIDLTYHELHNISNNIMPATLIDEGLIAATNELIATISNNKNIFIVFEAPQTIENLDDSKAFALFRILQETLSNIIKHAEATEVVVKIIKNSHSLSLIVSDNGKGMDVSKINDYAGMGWKNIYSRVATMLGEINVKSNPNLGTQITIDIGYES